MEKETEIELKKLIDKLNSTINENGLVISGMGILGNNTKKIVEALEKIDKKLYFLEKRQQDWFDNYVKPKQ